MKKIKTVLILAPLVLGTFVFLYLARDLKAQQCTGPQFHCWSSESIIREKLYCGSGVPCIAGSADCLICEYACGAGTRWTCNSCSGLSFEYCSAAYACSVDSCVCVEEPGSCIWIGPTPSVGPTPTETPVPTCNCNVSWCIGPPGLECGWPSSWCPGYCFIGQVHYQKGSCTDSSQCYSWDIFPGTDWVSCGLCPWSYGDPYLPSNAFSICVPSCDGATPTPPPPVTPTPTVPPGCICGDWVDLECGGGGICPWYERLQTRVCSPPLCLPTTNCKTDVDCLPSCEIELDPSYSVAAGETISFIPGVVSQNGDIDSIGFTITNPSYVTVCDSLSVSCPSGQISYTDTSPAFAANLTGWNLGSTTITVTGKMKEGPSCTPDTATIDVTNPSSWWQVIGGDINAGIAGSGNIASSIPVSCVSPCEPVLIADNPAGYPGVPSAGSITPATGISSTNWQATGASYSGKEVYDYAFFEKKISASVTPKDLGVSGSVDASQLNSGGFSYGGYFWYRYDGSGGAPSTLTINGNVNLAAGRKVILLVKNASLVISGKVNVDDGTSTFIAIVNGDIIVDPSVGGSPDNTPELEGIYLADGQVKTGLGATQLHIRGSVSGLGIEGEDLGENDGVVLERNLADNSQTPAELFEFAPDAMFLFPSALSPKRMGWWKEVAP